MPGSASTNAMFDTVLVANRGEIAVRIISTLRRMGVRAVAVYSDADADARHVRCADVGVRIGPAEAARSYLSIPDIVSAALESGAQAVHPGYGFLAENAEFARACARAGLIFIGPSADVLEAMGDKIHAKRTVSAAGVPVVPGNSDVDMDNAVALASAADEVGYPLLLKPSAGGGGKGMRLVASPEELADAAASARRESNAAFGDDRLLLERFVGTPRHIEIQVLADAKGNVIHLGERECSLQRRHQKIIEEAPSVLLDESMRARMGTAAVDAARQVGYVGAGTVEFIVSGRAPEEFFFMEMNTRLQVEHPVTELVTGMDLVEWQLRVAAGEPLAFAQQDIGFDGHAVEARVYAEDPARGFVPTGGTVLAVHEPASEHVRVDSWMSEGALVGSYYDPMLAKVIAWGSTRSSALRRLDGALEGTVVLGVGTNTAFLRALLADADVAAGRLDTELVERKLSTLVESDVPSRFFVAAALDRLLALEPSGPIVDPWQLPHGWRLGESAGVTFRLVSGETEAVVRVEGTSAAARVRSDDGEPVTASARVDEHGRLALWCGGQLRFYRRARAEDGTLWLANEGHSVAIAQRPNLLATQGELVEAGPVLSPMPGTVLVLKVAVGDVVPAGTPLLIVEAMKMEHTITAQIDGVVDAVHVRAGQQVGIDEPLAVVSPHSQPADQESRDD